MPVCYGATDRTDCDSEIRSIRFENPLSVSGEKRVGTADPYPSPFTPHSSSSTDL
jgi:hypothetical protein